MDWTRWQGLDLALSSPYLANLRKVDICLYIDGDSMLDPNYLTVKSREAKRLENVLPNLRERGVLCVHG